MGWIKRRKEGGGVMEKWEMGKKKATAFGCDEARGEFLKISFHQCFMSQITFPPSMASSFRNILLTRICVCMCV